MDPAEMTRPWLAGHLLALMGPGIPLKFLRNCSDRLLFTGMAGQNPGKLGSRVYSLLNCVEAHTMYSCVKLGVLVALAQQIGHIAGERLAELNDPTATGITSLRTPPQETVFVAQIEGGRFRHHIIPLPEVLPLFTRAVSTLPACLTLTIAMDELIEKLWIQFHEIPQGLNDLALERKLRPFPASLEEGIEQYERCTA